MKGKTICGIPIVANHDGIVDYACDEWVDEVLIRRAVKTNIRSGWQIYS